MGVKVMVTADLHIKDSAKFAKYKEFRLDQYIQVASLMNATAIEEGITHFILAGDLIDKALSPPVVYHTLYAFIDALVKDIPDYHVYICHGNHDTSSNFFTPEECTFYPILCRSYPGVKFLHNRSVNIGGKIVYFRGWQKEFSYETPPCDIFVSHYCLPTSVNREMYSFPGKLGKFENVKNLVILGDIHKFQFIENKILIPGCPVQSSFSDDPNTGYCVIDMEDLSQIQRYSTRNEEGLLKFLYPDDFDVAEYNKAWQVARKEEHTELSFEEWLFQEHNIVYRERKTKKVESGFDLKDISNLDLNGILEELLADFEYKNELFATLGSSKKSLDNFINRELNVTLKTIEITNFGSIQHLEFDFESVNPLTIIRGENGTGKAQPLTTKVLTPQGFRRFGDLSVGDTIYSADGSCTNVTGIFPQGIKPCYRVETLDGQVTECCDDHLWRVRVKSHGCYKEVVLPLKDILQCGLKPKKEYKFFLPTVNAIPYCEVNLPVDPYVLGVLIADGCIAESVHTPSFSTNERDIVTRVTNKLGSDYKITKYSQKNYSWHITYLPEHKRHVLMEHITALGLRKTSQEKFIPEIYLKASIEQRKQLLAGLFDCDGSVYKSRFSYSTRSLQLAKDVVSLCRSLGYQARLTSSNRNSGTDYTVSILTNDIIFLSEKHRARYKKGEGKNKSTYTHTAIKSITKIEDKEMQCIMVDHPSHLYITDDYIVTHNTTFFRAIVWALTGKSPTDKVEDVIKTGTSYCEITLTVEYQNKIIKIQRSRGSKFEFKVWVDNEPIDAVSKEDLQSKLKDALPIISKLHLLYFRQSQDGLLSGLTDTARVNLVSELTGMNLVSELSEVVAEKVESLKSLSEKDVRAYEKENTALEGLQAVYKEDLVDPTDKLKKVETKLKAVISEKEHTQAELSTVSDKYRTQYLEKQDEKKVVADELREKHYASTIDTLQKLNALKERRLHLDNEILKIKNEIADHQRIADKETEWVCRTCGTLVKASDFTQEDIDRARQNITDLTHKLELTERQKKTVKSLCSRTEVVVGHYDTEYQNNVDNEMARISVALGEIEQAERRETVELKAMLTKLTQQENTVRQEINDLTYDKGLFVKNAEIKEKITETIKSLKALEKKKQASFNKYNAFRKIHKQVFGMDGLLSAAVLEKLANVINTDENIEIVTYHTVKSTGAKTPTLDINMKIRGHWQAYRKLSGAEKLYADLYLLSKIIAVCGTVGFVALDEVLKYADAKRREAMLQILSQFPVRNCFLIIHIDGDLPKFILDNPNVSLMQVYNVNDTSIYTVT